MKRHDPVAGPATIRLMLLALAVPMALAGPVPTAAQDGWRARASYERQVVDSELPRWSDWESWGLEARRSWETGNLALELLRSRRFGVVEAAAAADGYLNITPRTYVHARLQVAPDARVRAGQDHRLEVFHATPAGWEASGGYRFMVFSPDEVHVFNASLARYLPDWYLRIGASVNPSFEENATSAAAAARRFIPSLDGYVEIAAGAGEEVVEVDAGPVVDIRSSRFASARTELFPWTPVGLAGQLSYHELGGLPSRLGLAATLIVRW